MQLIWEKSDVYKVTHVNQDDLWKKVIADLFEDFLLFFLPEFYHLPTEDSLLKACEGRSNE